MLNLIHKGFLIFDAARFREEIFVLMFRNEAYGHIPQLIDGRGITVTVTRFRIKMLHMLREHLYLYSESCLNISG